MTKQTLYFQCDSKLHTIFKQIAKYSFLNLITLFIYRFWAKTHIRRYFWSSVQLNKEAFTYHGTGKELFFGALMIFFILIVFKFAEYIIGFLVLENFAIIISYSLLVALAFGFMYHFAIYRMLNYRLTRTSWRGLRFGLNGKAQHYALQAWGLSLLNIISLSLIYPWTRSYLVNYRLNSMQFGNQNFSSTLSARNLLLPYYIILIPLLTALLLIGWTVYDAISLKAWNEIGELINNFNVTYLIIAASLIMFSVIGRIVYKIYEAKTILSHLHFANIAFTNELNVLKTSIIFCVLYFSYWLIILTIGAAFVILVNLNMFLIAVFVIYPFYLCYYFTSVAILSWIAKRLINKCRFEADETFLQNITASYQDAPKRGEGWFELLDIGNL